MSDYEGYEDSREHWRWCEHLTVVEAAMLSAGMNPSVWELANDKATSTGEFHEIGTSNHVDNYYRSEAFVPIFKGISRATILGELKCSFAHPARPVPFKQTLDDGYGGYRNIDEEIIDYDLLIKSGAIVDGNPFGDNYTPAGKFFFLKEPDWEQSTVAVEDLKAWMTLKGRKPTFFFPHSVAIEGAVSDRSHEHYAPELDMAVKAWNALLPERKFKAGPKAAILKWIEANSDQWGGNGKLSVSAKERIATMVNWDKLGGAPRSSG